MQDDCPFTDTKNIVACTAFLYGVAVTSPYNFILLSLPYIQGQMPDYPITFVATFAVNGVMVFVVFICLALPNMLSHAIKINLSLFFSGLLTLLLPLTAEAISGQAARFWVAICLMLLTGVGMGLALAQTLSYMSSMPERYMALNSMGIGFSGLISLILYGILLECFKDDDHAFALNIIFYSMNFVLMTGIASMYFIESRS